MNALAARKSFTAACCVLLLASYLYLCGSTFIVSRIATSWDPARLERATRIAPLDAALWLRLGEAKYFLEHDPKAAAAYFERAAELNPHDAKGWLALSLAYQGAGELNAQHRAIDGAVRADPTTPMFTLLAANSYFSNGDQKLAFLQLHNLIQHDDALTEPAVDLAWRATRDVGVVLAKVTGPNLQAQLAFNKVLVDQNLEAPAAQVWASVLALNRSFDPRLAFPYLQMLITEGEAGKAAKAWQDLIDHNPSLADYGFKDRAVVNPGFEQDILNGGFDWRYQPVENSQASIDGSAHNGKRSLLIASDGALGETGISQYIALQSGQRYKFSGFSKTAKLQGAGNFAWVIVDPAAPAAPVATIPLPVSDGWQQTRSTFSANPGHDLYLLKLVHQPAGTMVRGKVWVDDVAIDPE